MDIKSKSPKAGSHVDILDGLRGIAIITVLLFHIWQLSWLNHSIKISNFTIDLNFIPVTGFLGVELFFFISAFCLFYPYARYLFEAAQFQTVKQFAYKRAIKILPSYFLAIILIMIFANPGFSSLKTALWQVFTHLIFIHNLFPETYGAINGVFWSLGVEVQFYVIFPVVCWLFRKKPVTVYMIMSAGSIAYRYYIRVYQPQHLDFLLNQLPGFLDIFVNGMLAAYLLVFIRNKLKYYEKLAPFFTCFAGIMLAIIICLLKWLYDIRYQTGGVKIWQDENRFYLALAFMLLTVSSAFSMRFWKRIIANKVFVFMSVISYNLYIWHQFIAVIIFKRNLVPHKMQDPHGDPHWQLMFTVVSILAGILFSTIVTYVVERPLLKKGPRRVLLEPLGTVIFVKRKISTKG